MYRDANSRWLLAPAKDQVVKPSTTLDNCTDPDLGPGPSRRGSARVPVQQPRRGAGDIGSGLTKIRVSVKQPEIEHTVRVRDFENWLESAGRSPAEMALKSRLRELLSR
jgi:hypothetical protein